MSFDYRAPSAAGGDAAQPAQSQTPSSPLKRKSPLEPNSPPPSPSPPASSVLTADPLGDSQTPAAVLSDPDSARQFKRLRVGDPVISTPAVMPEPSEADHVVPSESTPNPRGQPPIGHDALDRPTNLSHAYGTAPALPELVLASPMPPSTSAPSSPEGPIHTAASRLAPGMLPPIVVPCELSVPSSPSTSASIPLSHPPLHAALAGPPCPSHERRMDNHHGPDSSPAAPLSPPVVHIPSPVSLISRETLRDLHNEHILNNAQLRHDLHFDPTLRFRPAPVTEKRRLATSLYWAAIERELQTGCTCTVFDQRQKPYDCVCVNRSPSLVFMGTESERREYEKGGYQWGRTTRLACAPDSTASTPNQEPSPQNSLSTRRKARASLLRDVAPTSRVRAMFDEMYKCLRIVMCPSSVPTWPAPITLSKQSSKDAPFASYVHLVGHDIASEPISSIPSLPRSRSPSPSPHLPPNPPLAIFDTVSHPASAAHIVHHQNQLSALFDTDLILQQITYGVFSPAAFFEVLGRLMKLHCAPLRDSLVDEMVKLAEDANAALALRSGRHIKLFVQALRVGFELIEIMKLDIANHQLQLLRPYFRQSTVAFELFTFRERQLRGLLSIDSTRRWLSHHYSQVIQTPLSPHINSPPPPSPKISRQWLILVALCNGVVDLVLTPPTTSSQATASFAHQVSLPPPSPERTTSPHRLHAQPQQAPWTSVCGYPDTFYLDQTRLSVLSADVSETLAMYLVLLLFRQTVASTKRRLAQEHEVEAFKKDVWVVGPERLGWTIWKSGVGSVKVRVEEEEEKDWREGMRGVALRMCSQLAKNSSSAKKMPQPESESTDEDGLLSKTDLRQLEVLYVWLTSNINPTSSLYTLAKHRIRTALLSVVYGAVRRTFWPDAVVPPHRKPGDVEFTSGLGALKDEVDTLALKIADVVSVHWRVYSHVYMASGFL